MAGFLLLGLALAPLAGAAKVSIRIEGQSTTLVPRTTVKTPGGALHADAKLSRRDAGRRHREGHLRQLGQGSGRLQQHHRR